MARQKLKLLALLAAFSVAPATAGHRTFEGAQTHGSECPYERARVQAAARADVASGDTIVTLTSRLPALSPRAAVSP